MGLSFKNISPKGKFKIFSPPNIIKGVVFLDENKDGHFDSYSIKLPNINIGLKNNSNNSTKLINTNAEGEYSFYDLDDGNYTVTISDPYGYGFTPQIGYLESTPFNSNVDESTGKLTVNLFGGQTMFVSAGILPIPSTVQGTIFTDINTDGIFDGSESGINNVTLTLTNTHTNDSLTTQTNSSGNYTFSNLDPGNYDLYVTDPIGYGFSPQDIGANDNIDSDVDQNTGRINLDVSSDTTYTIDAGILPVPGMVQGTVFTDNDFDGVKEVGDIPLNDVLVELTNNSTSNTLSTTTDSNGEYGFSDLSPGSYTIKVYDNNNHGFTTQNVGGNDSLDSDVDQSTGELTISVENNNVYTIDAGILPEPGIVQGHVFVDENGDGIYSSGDVNKNNVTVTLENTSTSNVESTQTDVNGNYIFNNVTVGNYTVKVVDIDGHGFTTQNIGADDSIDSDVNQSTGELNITVSSGQTYTIDAGILPAPGIIQGHVFVDEDGSGIKNAGDTAKSNSTVRITNNLTNDYRTTQTDVNGNYIFNDVTIGNYTIKFYASNGFTTQNVGTDDSVDSDVNQSTGELNLSVSSGQTYTIDAGLVPAPPSPVFATQQTRLRPNDATFYDKSFGYSVDISADGNTAVVGWPGYGGDAVYGNGSVAVVFTRAGTTWTKSATLTPYNYPQSDAFGTNVAITADGSKIFVQSGSHAETQDGTVNPNQGYIFVFTGSGDSWTEVGKFRSNDFVEDHRFGGFLHHSFDISNDGSTVVVGAPRRGSNAAAVPGALRRDDEPGAAYVFTGSGGSYSQRAIILPDVPIYNAQFGWDVAISGDGNTIAVGEPNALSTIHDIELGSVFIYTGSGGSWTKRQRVYDSDTEEGDSFGSSVALDYDGSTLAVGAKDESNQRGAVYTFNRSGALGTTYVEDTKLVGYPRYQQDWFASDVDLSDDGNTLVVGAYWFTAPNAGAAFSFVRSDYYPTWGQRTHIIGSNVSNDDHFGYSIAVSGDGTTLIIGAPRWGHFYGETYIFV